MPTLLYGCVVDAWLCNRADSRLMNFQGSTTVLPASVQHRYDEIFHKTIAGGWDGLRQMDRRDGPLTYYVRQTMARGRLPAKDDMRVFREELRSLALSRLQDCYWQWGRLKTSDADTFACLWGTGAVAGHPDLAPYCDVPWAPPPPASGGKLLRLGAGMVNPGYHARAEGKPRAELPPLLITDLNPWLETKLQTLIDDAVTHLEWILLWPSVVQAVRSINDGRLPCDVPFDKQMADETQSELSRTPSQGLCGMIRTPSSGYASGYISGYTSGR